MEDSILDFTTNLAILHRQFQRAMNQLLEADKMPVNITEFYLLVLISETRQLNQRRAAWTMAVDEGLMARMVHHLVELELIQKETDPRDRRNRRLQNSRRLVKNSFNKPSPSYTIGGNRRLPINLISTTPSLRLSFSDYHRVSCKSNRPTTISYSILRRDFNE